MNTPNGYEFEILVKAIAQVLGDGWTYLSPEEPLTRSSFARIEGAEGRKLYLSLSGSYDNPDRINISGSFNIGRNGQYVTVYEQKTPNGGWEKAVVPSISVALSRGAEVIAREIQRRFLPEYDRVFKLALAQVAKDAAYVSQVTDKLTALAAAVDKTLPTEDNRSEPRTSFTFYQEGGASGTVKAGSSIDGSSIDLDLSSLTLSQALHVLRFIKDTENASNARC